MIYIKLFWEFFKTGLLATGGGMATVPFLIEISNKTNWFSIDELANIIAVSESTPGPIGINMSTYVGYNTAGILGSLVATLSLILPAVLIIIAISAFLTKFMDYPVVKKVFYVLRACVIGLISFALFSVCSMTFIKGSFVEWKSLAAFAVIFVLVLKLKKMHPILFIALGALFGLFFL